MTEGVFVARLTADVVAAIATIGVRGGAAASMVQRFVALAASGSPGPHWEINRLYFGMWRSPGIESGEHVVLCRTDEQTVEVHCHGGQAVSRQIMDDLAQEGCIATEPWQWTTLELSPNDGYSGRTPLCLAAERELVRATAPRTAMLLLDQVNGALDRAIERVLDDVRGQRLELSAERVDRLLTLSPLGQRLSRPWRVVLAGPPNVGKSSLINALSGERRAIVHDQPGTTRDWLEVETLIDGWPVAMTDTAGIRQQADSSIEAEGILRARQQIKPADLVLLIVDASVGWTGTHVELCSELTQLGKRSAMVLNKIDRVEDATLESLNKELHAISPSIPIFTSSCTNEAGVATLVEGLGSRLVEHLPTPGEGIPFTAAQVTILQSVEQALQQGDANEAERWLHAMLHGDFSR